MVNKESVELLNSEFMGIEPLSSLMVAGIGRDGCRTSGVQQLGHGA